ncbi:hypothetical protein GGR54DRAFT_51559 [Hypoxylon sp. NC1633]|nr:hypothetical protein GGR54DRAFT_51559 [Hypoxylon sp. NC1633]
MSSGVLCPHPDTVAAIMSKYSLLPLVLDQAAQNADDDTKGNTQPSFAEKVTEYVPAAAKLLGNRSQGDKSESTSLKRPPGPPDRPNHDGQIEEFVRDQHRSKKQDALPLE